MQRLSKTRVGSLDTRNRIHRENTALNLRKTRSKLKEESGVLAQNAFKAILCKLRIPRNFKLFCNFVSDFPKYEVGLV